MKTRLTPVLAGVVALACILLAPSAVGSSSAEGTISSVSFHSATLNEQISYNVYLPDGYATSTGRYPVLYLLHGRGDSMSAWTRIKGTLDELIAAGDIPPIVAVMPAAPWSSRASYYVDSRYTGPDPGRPVETAFTKDLIQHVDATYRTVADRSGRGVAGYSMGGYGAIRWSLAHPDLFGAAIVLSPAVYYPLPPKDSSTREFGAFGDGRRLFVEKIYRELNYPALFDSFEATGLELPMFIAVGDDEFKNPDPRDATHDLDFEAHVLFNQAARVENLSSELRVVDGGHDWDVWEPTFVEGAKYVFRFLRPPAALMKATLTGTAQEERAGGVATDAAGNVYEALAAGGSVNGQPFAGDKDLVLVKRSPAGATLWTRELGSGRLERAYGVAVDPQGDVVVTGYTNGDFDGAHAGNTTDDIFVAKFDPDGNQEWLRQIGVPGVADRGYALATDAAGNVYVTGYTRGNLAAVNAGDKDVYVLKLDPAGTQLWLQQFGSGGEDKAWGVAATADGIRLAGMTSGALGTTPAGSLDGWVARYDAGGTRIWLTQFGTGANEEVWGLTADAAGNAYAAGYSAGDFDGPLAGDKDITVARFDADGTLTWKDQLGTDLNDKGAAIGLDPAGNLYLAGFSDGRLVAPVGRFDAILVKYAPDTTRLWTRQFGTTEDDGADAFAEANLYLATHGDAVYVSGLTLGAVEGQGALGNGDVFLARFDAQGANG